MTDPLFRWLVYPAAFPISGKPQLLGELEAPTLAAAKNQAAARWPGVATLIQSAASARVRSVTALPAPDAVRQPINQPGPRRGKHSKSRQQLDAFCAAKRAAHGVTKRHIHPTRSE